MGLKVKDVLRQMRVYLNEYATEVMDDFMTETEADMIAHIDAAARLVAQVAPANMQVATDAVLSLTEEERPDGLVHGMAALPDGYMRMIYLVVEGKLYRYITQLLPPTHPTYAMQFSPIAGLGSGAYAPTAYLIDGTVDVHAWPANESSNVNDNVNDTPANAAGTTAVLKYLAIPKITTVAASGNVPAYDEYATLKDELRDVIAMQAAALYLGITDNEKANVVQQIATGMIGGLVSRQVDE